MRQGCGVGIELGLLIVGQKRSDPGLLVGPDRDRRVRCRWVFPRVAEIQQPPGCVVVNVCSSDISGQNTYTYNMAGKLKTYGDGMASNVFTSTYDAAGRLQTLTSSWNDALHPQNLFTARSYNPAGGLTSALYGTGLN